MHLHFDLHTLDCGTTTSINQCYFPASCLQGAGLSIFNFINIPFAHRKICLTTNLEVILFCLRIAQEKALRLGQ